MLVSFNKQHTTYDLIYLIDSKKVKNITNFVGKIGETTVASIGEK